MTTLICINDLKTPEQRLRMEIWAEMVRRTSTPAEALAMARETCDWIIGDAPKVIDAVEVTDAPEETFSPVEMPELCLYCHNLFTDPCLDQYRASDCTFNTRLEPLELNVEAFMGTEAPPVEVPKSECDQCGMMVKSPCNNAQWAMGCLNRPDDGQPAPVDTLPPNLDMDNVGDVAAVEAKIRDEEAIATKAPVGVFKGSKVAPSNFFTQWTEERRARLHDLCKQGMVLREISDAMGIRIGSIESNIYRFGFKEDWTEGKRKRSYSAPQESPFGKGRALAEVDASERPPPAETLPPPAAKVKEIPLPAPPPPAAARDIPETDRDRMIAEHVATKGLTTEPPEFGVDQPAVEYLRERGHIIERSVGKPGNRKWMVDFNRTMSTVDLWKWANRERKHAGLGMLNRAEPFSKEG